ncbi:MAG: hypothetical protein QW199_01970 [Candidatus Pacearchaeota archaeon]
MKGKMGRKLIALFILLSLLSMSFCLALSSSDELTKVKRGYNWLNANAIKPGSNEIELSISTFALKERLSTNQIKLINKTLLEKSYGNGTCWPGPQENSCDVLVTAIVKFGLDSIGLDTSKATEWLRRHFIPIMISDIKWYLQLTSPNAFTCYLRINDSAVIQNVSFNEAGSIVASSLTECFSEAAAKYWLEINQSCLNKSFEIICDKDVKANFIFASSASGAWFVPGETFELSANVASKLSIPVQYCLAPTNTCNYEASAWMAFALQQVNSSLARSFLLYLLSKASENQKYLPYAFLYALMNSSEYSSNVVALRKPSGLIEAPSSAYNEYYDTGLAGMTGALEGVNLSVTKATLLSNQSAQGFWLASRNNDTIRDTALILAGIWPGFTGYSACELAGYSCVANCSATGGILQAFSCFVGECCNINGIEGACEIRGGNCTTNTTCSANETQVPYACSSGKCCKPLSQSLCVAEINGSVCLPSQKCVAAGSVVPFISSSDSNYCCKGNCTTPTPTKSCAELGGEICDSNAGKSCSQGKWLLNANDTSFCCQQGYCSAALLPCAQQNGIICKPDEECVGGYPVIASDTGNKPSCCTQGGRCVATTCQYSSCAEDEGCSGKSYETSDALKCCEGECLKSCSALGGQTCNANQKCKGELVSASDVTSCCIGQCKEKAGFPFGILIFILLVLGLGVAGFILFKKGKLSKEKIKAAFSGLGKIIKIKKKPRPGTGAQAGMPAAMPPTMPAIPRGMPRPAGPGTK